jgi:hypothetical protein
MHAVSSGKAKPAAPAPEPAKADPGPTGAILPPAPGRLSAR